MNEYEYLSVDALVLQSATAYTLVPLCCDCWHAISRIHLYTLEKSYSAYWDGHLNQFLVICCDCVYEIDELTVGR